MTSQIRVHNGQAEIWGQCYFCSAHVLRTHGTVNTPDHDWKEQEMDVVCDKPECRGRLASFYEAVVE